MVDATMSRGKESLRELLSRVHERLSHADSVDPESRELLVEIMDDIERALGKQGVSKQGVEHPVPRLESLAVQFEAEYPALAQTVRQLADVLGKAGI
jgi:hypothetical protein